MLPIEAGGRRAFTLAKHNLAQGTGGCCDCLALVHKPFVEILRSNLLLQGSMSLAYTGWRQAGSHAGKQNLAAASTWRSCVRV